MREFREDGTLEGLPVYGRVYYNAYEGQVDIRVFVGERESDVAKVESYTCFRGWATPMMSNTDAVAKRAELSKSAPPISIVNAERAVWATEQAVKRTQQLITEVATLESIADGQEKQDYRTMLNHLDSIHRMLTT